MLSVSGRESTNTGLTPNIAKALAVETKVNDGTMISSPGFSRLSSADISSACVHELVSSTRLSVSVFSNNSSVAFVNVPLPEYLLDSIAWDRNCWSSEVTFGILKKITQITTVMIILEKMSN